MSGDESPAEWTRLARARGPRVLLTRVWAIWLGVFAALVVAGAIDRKNAVAAVVAAIVLAAALIVLVRTWTAGVFTNGTIWELRGVLDRTRIHRGSISAIGLTDEWALGGPIRMLSIDQRLEDPVTFPLIAWGNQLNSFHYGAGVSNDESPRQALGLDALRNDAQLKSDHM